ncbi:MAG: NeuD/PglB/VioB family sugar acetyltransferase [Prevotella sp.]|nr:NeuD/PglB/VioB family sugar acetyltransferase [Prevotella sp.]
MKKNNIKLSSKQRLAILGAGELGRQIGHYALLDGRYNVVGFLDDTKEKGTLCAEFSVLGKMEELEALYHQEVFDCIFIGIGYAHFEFKASLYEKVKKNNIPLATIIAPHVYIDPTAVIGMGVILYPGCVIDKDVVIEDNVVINLNVVVAHNSVVGKHSFIAGGAVLAGYAKVGECCFLGVNSVVNDHKYIGDNVIIGSQTIVSKNIKDPGTYFNDNRRLYKF